ncbi:MAG: type II toxin-antitoxin system HicA family toxin [Anaerolineae bacterium]|nr:type II toxin-antitoxin system HicA family toxin [Anaerolineae bacterium]
MSKWPSTKARRVLAALLRIGWTIKRESGSHRTLSRPGWPDVVFAFHDRIKPGRGCYLALQKLRPHAGRSLSTLSLHVCYPSEFRSNPRDRATDRLR